MSGWAHLVPADATGRRACRGATSWKWRGGELTRRADASWTYRRDWNSSSGSTPAAVLIEVEAAEETSRLGAKARRAAEAAEHAAWNAAVETWRLGEATSEVLGTSDYSEGRDEDAFGYGAGSALYGGSGWTLRLTLPNGQTAERRYDRRAEVPERVECWVLRHPRGWYLAIAGDRPLDPLNRWVTRFASREEVELAIRRNDVGWVPEMITRIVRPQ